MLDGWFQPNAVRRESAPAWAIAALPRAPQRPVFMIKLAEVYRFLSRWRAAQSFPLGPVAQRPAPRPATLPGLATSSPPDSRQPLFLCTGLAGEVCRPAHAARLTAVLAVPMLKDVWRQRGAVVPGWRRANLVGQSGHKTSRLARFERYDSAVDTETADTSSGRTSPDSRNHEH